MQIKTFVLTLALTVSPLTALAGGGHNHGYSHEQASAEITQDQAETAANLRVDILVNKGKIDKSWKLAKVASSEQKMNGHQNEWVITYNNGQVSDITKRTLYVFISVSGDYVAANFSGK